MNKALKQSFYEASVKVEEEFESVEKAHLSNGHSNMAKVEIQDLKLDKSRVSLINKEKNTDGSRVLSKKGKGTKDETRGDGSKDAQA